jgi:hypothetical protein
MTPDELWDRARPASERFEPAALGNLPDAARRYLEHAIAPGAPLATAARFTMRGEIRLGRWRPFAGDEAIDAQRGFVWRATTRLAGLPVRGYDAFVDGVGVAEWKLAGLIRVASGSGADVSRSAAARFAAELIWLPSALWRPSVRWTSPDASHARATLDVAGHAIDLDLGVDADGRLRTIALERWGEPERNGFRRERFGGVMLREATFGGYTIPAEVRVGWYFGSARFESEGAFFRAELEDHEVR